MPRGPPISPHLHPSWHLLTWEGTVLRHPLSSSETDADGFASLAKGCLDETSISDELGMLVKRIALHVCTLFVSCFFVSCCILYVVWMLTWPPLNASFILSVCTIYNVGVRIVLHCIQIKKQGLSCLLIILSHSEKLTAHIYLLLQRVLSFSSITFYCVQYILLTIN